MVSHLASNAGVCAEVLVELARWKHLGVAAFPGPRGRKGPRIDDWPTLPHSEAWWLTREAASSGPTNLTIRTGATADGTRCAAAIDLDGKCSCEHDRDEHPQGTRCLASTKGSACECASYDGTPPEVALERLLAVLPPGVAVNRTARGFHVICWTARPLPNGKLKEYSADFFGGETPHALQVPPSLHPDGHTYEWVHEPGDAMPMVDLEALGLVPNHEDTNSGLRRPKIGARSGRKAPAPISVQQEFASLMAELGVRPRSRREEFALCPFHVESAGSCHVD